MNKYTAIIALLTLSIGFGGGYLIGGSKPAEGTHTMPSGMAMDDNEMSMGSAMNNMMSELNGKKGDAFDKSFLSAMIEHHQGAVQMAEAALTDARHDEIKQMARSIITAQTAEISQMREWQKNWYRIQ